MWDRPKNRPLTPQFAGNIPFLSLEPLATVPRCGQSQNERKECALLKEREIQKGLRKVTCEENLNNKKLKLKKL